MDFELLLPQMGMGMQDGLLSRWLKQEGDSIRQGEMLCEIESAKSTVEIESPVAGILRQIIVPEGEMADVQAVLAIIDTDDALAVQSTVPIVDDVVKEKNTIAPIADQKPSIAVTVQMEPRARRLVDAEKIDPSGIVGTGPNGRITLEDVEALLKASSSSVVGIDTVPVSHSAMRRAIAARVVEAKQTVPHFYLKVSCDVDALLQLRKKLNAQQSDAAVSLNDFIVKAFALALQDVPDAHVSWADQGMCRYDQVDLSVAIATDNGLVTPVVRNVAAKNVMEISTEIRTLSQQARSGKLNAKDLDGGQATISNLGMYGIEEFTAIINPPQALVLAVGAAAPQAVVRDDALTIAPVMTCNLSVDHRAIDGAVAARFLAAFKSIIEQPSRLI